MCQCGQPVYVKKTGECQTCYNRRYYLAHKPPREPAPRLGETPATATPCSYWAAHDRVRRTRGLPAAHTCTECGAPATEWAYRNHSPHEITGAVTRSGRDGRKTTRTAAWSPYVWDYDPLCHDCHQARDAAILPSTAGKPVVHHRDACQHGHPLTGANVIKKSNGSRECRECRNSRRRQHNNAA